MYTCIEIKFYTTKNTHRLFAMTQNALKGHHCSQSASLHFLITFLVILSTTTLQVLKVQYVDVIATTTKSDEQEREDTIVLAIYLHFCGANKRLPLKQKVHVKLN